MGVWVGMWSKRVVGQGMHIMYMYNKIFHRQKIENFIFSISQFSDNHHSNVFSTMTLLPLLPSCLKAAVDGRFFCRPTTKREKRRPKLVQEDPIFVLF